MRSLGRPELATVVLAVIRGLLKDLDATGDTARTDRAFHDFPRHNRSRELTCERTGRAFLRRAN